MARKEVTKIIKRFGGWWDENDREVARFPSPHLKDKCSREFARLAAVKLAA